MRPLKQAEQRSGDDSVQEYHNVAGTVKTCNILNLQKGLQMRLLDESLPGETRDLTFIAHRLHTILARSDKRLLIGQRSKSRDYSRLSKEKS